MNRFLILSILLLLSSSYTHAHNKPHPPSPAPVSTPTPKSSSKSDCSTVIYGMMDCLSYLSPGSNDTKPVKTCCTAIEAVLKYNPQCICIGLKSSQDMGIALNDTRALDTPKACKLAIAPPNCGIKTGGAPTPVPSPVSPSSGTHKTPSSSKSPSPTTSPTLAESPAITSPSPSVVSGTNNLSIPTLTLVAVLVCSFGYISAFFN